MATAQARNLYRKIKSDQETPKFFNYPNVYLDLKQKMLVKKRATPKNTAIKLLATMY